ncbi:MAG: tetratricopeptide repeat-containing diguanylate cyclase [Dokdonella sp.]
MQRLAWLLALASASIACPPATAAEALARAQLAANTQQFAAAMDHYADAGGAAAARAIGGGWAEQSLMMVLANLSAAMDAPTRADRQWMRAAEIAQQRGDDAALILILSGATQTALSLGDYERCITLAGRLSELSRQHGDRVGEAIAEGVLGVVARRLGHLDEALRHAERALELQRSAGNAAGAALVLGDLSVVYRDRGDFARALDSGLEAVAQRERSGDKLDNAYRNVALLYREIEDASTARMYFERALDAAAKRGAPSAYATVVGSYASFLNDAGESVRAQAAAQEALAIDDALDDRPHQGLEHLEIGRALLGQHIADSAVSEFEQALALGRELGQREIVARALLHLSEVALTRHDTLRARGMIDEAIAGLEAARLRPQLAQAYALREQLARAESDDVNALRFAHKYAAEREELLGIRASRQLAAMETRHAREEAEQRLALLAKDNELKAARIQAQQLQWRLYAAAVAGLLVLLTTLVWRYRGISRLNQALALRNAEVERQRAALSEANSCLELQAADLYQAATTDWLTRTDNRRHLREQLERRLLECRRDDRELALLAIDFDHFKQINDRGGHPFGDRVLVAGARAMRECLGPNDLLGRFGGEEFVAVACDRDPAAALALAERIRTHVAEQLAALAPELRTMATISIGVARLAQLDEPIHVEALLEAADRALYAAKSEGRNRVARYAA